MRTAIVSVLSLVALGLARPAPGAEGLAYVGRVKNNAGPVVGLHGVLALAMSPDGRNLYAASDVNSSLTVFRRDPDSGLLQFVERHQDNTAGEDGLDHVRAVVVSPDGANVYAAGEQDDAIAVFARDPGTGTLAFEEVDRNGIAGIVALNGPRCLAVTPDGAQVYVGAGGSDALVVFARDPNDGALSFATEYQDGDNGVNGLRGTESLAFGPDGRHLYVAASGDNSVAVFLRHPNDGAVAYLGRYHHGTLFNDGLNGVRSVVVAPDDQTLYAAGTLDDAVSILQRDSATSALGFLDEVRDTVDGVDGLDAVEAVALSPDGQLLYAVASRDNSVAVFERDAASGELTFVHAQKDGMGEVTNMLGAKAIAVSPDGASVYVAAAGSDTIDVFDTRCGDGAVRAGEQCDDGNAVAGDGCSPGCRRECVAATDCDDGDRCTEEVCRGGECALPQCGFRGAICELKQATPAFAAMNECLPIDGRLGRTIRGHLARARMAVQLVQHPPPPPLKKNGKPKHVKHVSSKALARQVTQILGAVEQKAGKLADAGAISPECLTAIRGEAETLASDVGSTLEMKGLCAP